MAYTKLNELKSAVLDCMDVAAEYADIGVQVLGSVGHSTDWVTCRAYQKNDANPSAEICVKGKSKGQYVDFSGGIGGGRSIGFFDFCVAAGKCPSWTDALKHYAKKYNLEFERMRDPAKMFKSMKDNQNAFLSSWASSRTTTEDAVLRAGGFGASFPMRNPEPCVMLPVFGTFGTADSPCGYVAWKKSGEPFAGRDGGNGPKMMTVAGSEAGLMGKFGLERLDKADVIWKTEGPSDMLALMSIIPETLRETHIVITNSAGCSENPKLWVINLLSGKVVNIIHDADIPGQRGATTWTNALAENATVRNIQLPYEIKENHGKDLRDWIQDGGTYEALMAITEHTETSQVVTIDPLKSEKEVLDKLGLEMLGEYPNQAVAVFSQYYRKIVTIPDLDKLTYTKLLQIAGPKVRNFVVETQPEGEQVTLRTVKNAMAMFAALNNITVENTKGQGVWITRSGHVIAVGKGEAIAWDGVSCESVTTPRYEEFLLDFTSGESFWPEKIQKLLKNYTSEDGKIVVETLEDIFQRWCWENPTPTPELPARLVTGLVLATPIQTVFKWRPMISVTGESESGKTTLIQTIVNVFGKLGEKLANVTEAAIRQYVKNTAKGLFLDEFESNANRPKIFELLRTASDGSKLIRGTQDQRGVSYGLQHLVWMLAIEINLKRAPDQNRFIELGLVKPKDFGNLNIPCDEILAELGYAMIVACIHEARKIRDIAEELSKLQTKYYNSREIQTFVAPAATYAVLSGQSENAKEILAYMLSWIAHRDIQSDQEDLLQTILSTEMQYKMYTADQGIYTLGQLIEQALLVNRDDLLHFLETKGIKVNCSSHSYRDYSECVFFAKGKIEKMLERTQWDGQSVIQILKRFPGAEIVQRRIASCGQLRGVNLPVSLFIQEPQRNEYESAESF